MPQQDDLQGCSEQVMRRDALSLGTHRFMLTHSLRPKEHDATDCVNKRYLPLKCKRYLPLKCKRYLPLKCKRYLPLKCKPYLPLFEV